MKNKRLLKKAFLFSILWLPVIPLLSQTRVVHGQLPAFNKYPLCNVEVTAKKSKAAIKSDTLGRFAIVCKEKDVIKIKPRAFKSTSRRVGPETDSLVVNLIFVDNKANREYAAGYGFINEDDLAYAIANLSHENNDFCNYIDIFELLEGKLPGVTVERSMGGGAIYIRGNTSLNLGNEALYVVDGIIQNNISTIHPCDVRSLDVIKDGSAAMYGSRGANGVVVITTKRGGD